MLTLPIDIIDHILSFLQSHLLSDFYTLKKCAQSHPTLSKLADRYIYADIELLDNTKGTGGRAFVTEEFAQILADKPEIAFHVRSVTVYLQVEDDWDADPEEDEGSYLDVIASLLPMFSGLMKITLDGHSGSWGGLSWDILPETFHQAIYHILQLPGMKNVYIYKMTSFPISVLNTCKNVSVTLDTCADIQYDEESREGLSYTAFEHLSLRYCRDGTSQENILAWVKIHNLRSLMFIGWAEDESKFLPRLLAVCFNSLTNLELDIGAQFRTSFKIAQNGIDIHNDIGHFPFTLTGLVHLERLTIDAFLSVSLDSKDYFESPVPAITELVHTASRTLKQVTLKFCWRLKDFPDPDIIWSPFIPLATKCSSLSISIYVSPRVSMASHLPPSDIRSSITGCAGLDPYVRTGVLVVV